MINKCRIKMARRGLFNVRDPPRGGDRKNRERTLQQSKLHLQLGPSSFNSIFFVLAQSSSKSIPAIVNFIRTQFFNPLFTNLLYWAHWADIPLHFELGCLKRVSTYIYIYICVCVCVCVCVIINIKVYHKTFPQFKTNYSWF